MGGCSSGCQSGASDALRACVSVMPTLLLGTWNTVPSSLGAGAPAATGYAQPGMPGALVTGAAGAFCCARGETANATTRNIPHANVGDGGSGSVLLRAGR